MKKKKREPLWKVFAKGLALTITVYLAGQLLTAFLAVRGILPSEQWFGIVAALAVVASFLGGSYCAIKCPWGTLLSALLCGGLFAFLAFCVSLFWQEPVSAHGWTILLCILFGSTLSGLAGSRRRTQKRRRGL